MLRADPCCLVYAHMCPHELYMLPQNSICSHVHMFYHQMYMEALEWRRLVNPTRHYETYQPPAVLRRYYPGGFYGRDKSGNACYVDRAGRIDPKGILKHTTLEEVSLRVVSATFVVLYRIHSVCPENRYTQSTARMRTTLPRTMSQTRAHHTGRF